MSDKKRKKTIFFDWLVRARRDLLMWKEKSEIEEFYQIKRIYFYKIF